MYCKVKEGNVKFKVMGGISDINNTFLKKGT